MGLADMFDTEDGVIPAKAEQPSVRIELSPAMAEQVKDCTPGAPVRVKFAGVVKMLQLGGDEDSSGYLEIELGKEFSINADANNSIAKMLFESDSGEE